MLIYILPPTVSGGVVVCDSNLYREPAGCKDKHAMCGTWALFGECDVNPIYMVGSEDRARQGQCMRSCGRCAVFDPWRGMRSHVQQALTTLCDTQRLKFKELACREPCGSFHPFHID
jgi:hypothetical protein